MIRIVVDRMFTDGKRYQEMYGLSTEDKPVANLITGSKFTEVNTGDVYLFDETSTGTWTKVVAGYVAPES